MVGSFKRIQNRTPPSGYDRHCNTHTHTSLTVANSTSLTEARPYVNLEQGWALFIPRLTETHASARVGATLKGETTGRFKNKTEKATQQYSYPTHHLASVRTMLYRRRNSFLRYPNFCPESTKKLTIYPPVRYSRGKQSETCARRIFTHRDTNTETRTTTGKARIARKSTRENFFVGGVNSLKFSFFAHKSYLFTFGHQSEFIFGEILRRSLLLFALVLVHLHLVGGGKIVPAAGIHVRHGHGLSSTLMLFCSLLRRERCLFSGRHVKMFLSLARSTLSTLSYRLPPTRTRLALCPRFKSLRPISGRLTNGEPAIPSSASAHICRAERAHPKWGSASAGENCAYYYYYYGRRTLHGLVIVVCLQCGGDPFLVSPFRSLSLSRSLLVTRLL